MTTDASPSSPNNGILGRLARVTAAIEDGLLVMLLSAMIVLAGSQIVLRNFWDAGLFWADPLLRVSVLWVGLLGAMAATRDDNHITVDILSRVLSERARSAGRVITDLFTSAVCGLLAYHGARMVRMDYEAGLLAFAAVPAWACELIIPIGFGVIAVRFLLSSLDHLWRFSGARQ